MIIYGDRQSGNCYKIQLLCALLNIPHQWQDVDILAGETQAPEFLENNPNGKIPLLRLPDGRLLAESNAILNFLAHGSHLLPKDPFQLAKVQQWQFFEQYSHEPHIAVARFIQHYLGLPEDKKQQHKEKQVGGHKALTVMEQQLQNTDFLIGQQLSTADISLYAYTHVAHQGGFNLAPYANIQRWLQRIKAQPGYCPMG